MQDTFDLVKKVDLYFKVFPNPKQEAIKDGLYASMAKEPVEAGVGHFTSFLEFCAKSPNPELDHELFFSGIWVGALLHGSPELRAKFEGFFASDEAKTARLKVDTDLMKTTRKEETK